MPLHRRTSSAALYQPLTPQPGVGDITDGLESFSSATPRPRTGSFAAQQKELEALEEKEGFISETAYDLPGGAGGGSRAWRKKETRSGCFGWKSKLALLMLVGAGIGAGSYYLFYRDTGLWWTGSGGGEEVAGWSESASPKMGSAATGVANYAKTQSAKATSSVAAYDDDEEASYYLNEDEEEFESSPYEQDSYSSTSSSRLAAPSSARKQTASTPATSEAVAKLLANGTLAAYTWHGTLPSLNGSTESTGVSTMKKQGGGRLVVVGDIHGTHTSLIRLLKRLTFSPSHDTLIHTGDILGKSSLSSSLTTISLLRKLGAKGVRGNHDQRVLEWRKWMEAYGPLGHPSSSDAGALKGVLHAVVGAGSRAQSGFAAAAVVKQNAKSGFRKVAGGAAAKLGAPAYPRAKAKRGWIDWITGSSASGDAGAEEMLDEADGMPSYYASEDAKGGASSWADEDAQEEGPSWSELRKAAAKISYASESSASSIASSASKASTSTTAGVRKPFGRPTSLSSSSSRTSSSFARPSSTGSSRLSNLASSSHSSSTSASGALTGPQYSWISPSLSASELEKLGVEVPEGWEWGGEHFEIARHLTTKDVEYLESLPLTLWVEEIKSWVVHAGMVPWTSLSTTLSRLPTSTLSTAAAEHALPSILTSTSPLEFSPVSALSRLLSRSSRTALLLEPLNTDPFTLLNMRTLHSSSSSSAGTRPGSRVKGPATEWMVSSKGKKASKGSKPWWSVWDEGMKECGRKNEEKEEEDEEPRCEEAGVVYGHWAGQGLKTDAEFSIGLDSGCVYGRRLSALVVSLDSYSTSPLSHSTSSSLAQTLSNSLENSTSTLNNLTSSASHRLQNSTASAKSSSTADSTSTSTTRAKPNWHGGIQRITKSASSTLSSVPSSAASVNVAASAEADDSTSYYRDEDSEGDEGDAATKPWWRPWKRAPPQGRPGVAPWAGEHAEENESGYGYEEDEEEMSSSSTATGRRGRPTKAASSSSSSSSSGKSTSSPAASPLTSASRKLSSLPSSASLIDLDSDDAKLPSLETEDGPDDEGDFEEQRVDLKQAPEGVRAWIVGVDCAEEVDLE
ncbi:hypothetical protein JCM10213_003799 [Rhodosporidiobolus nylandii]